MTEFGIMRIINDEHPSKHLAEEIAKNLEL
jgi:hypothetical protein